MYVCVCVCYWNISSGIFELITNKQLSFCDLPPGNRMYQLMTMKYGCNSLNTTKCNAIKHKTRIRSQRFVKRNDWCCDLKPLQNVTTPPPPSFILKYKHWHTVNLEKVAKLCIGAGVCECMFFFTKQVLSIFSYWINLKTYYFVQFYLTWTSVEHTHKQRTNIQQINAE